jgi:hypothetical protein
MGLKLYSRFTVTPHISICLYARLSTWNLIDFWMKNQAESSLKSIANHECKEKITRQEFLIYYANKASAWDAYSSKEWSKGSPAILALSCYQFHDYYFLNFFLASFISSPLRFWREPLDFPPNCETLIWISTRKMAAWASAEVRLIILKEIVRQTSRGLASCAAVYKKR